MSGTENRLWAVRGAAQAERNDEPSILAATEELMTALMERNGLVPDDSSVLDPERWRAAGWSPRALGRPARRSPR